MANASKQIAPEKDTVRTMVGMYCAGRHGTPKSELCLECTELFDYATNRIERCPLRDDKPKCSKCEVHCYAPR